MRDSDVEGRCDGALVGLSIFVDLANNPAGAGDPLKRSRVAVVDPDVLVDRFCQFMDTSKRASPDSFPRNLGKPALDLVEPRGTGRREMNVIARPRSQPLLDLRMLMRALVV
jgi:hypothetical protein